MTVRIKEVVIRYEDDGEVSPLSADEHHEKFAPLRMVVHHHCAPAPSQRPEGGEAVMAEDEPKEYKIDLNEIAATEAESGDP